MNLNIQAQDSLQIITQNRRDFHSPICFWGGKVLGSIITGLCIICYPSAAFWLSLKPTYLSERDKKASEEIKGLFSDVQRRGSHAMDKGFLKNSLEAC